MLWKGYYPLCSSLVCCPSQATPRQRDGTAESKWEERQWGSRWHTNVWIGLGHHLSTPGLNCQQKMDFTHNIFSITGEARSCLNANTRFSCLRCLYEFRWPNPTANRLRLHTRQQTGNNKNTGSSSAAVQAEKESFRAEDAEFISTLVYHLHSGRKTFVISKTRVAEHKHTLWLIWTLAAFRKKAETSMCVLKMR